jgi:hypothetical protein
VQCLTLLEDITDNMKFVPYMAFSFITFFHILLVPFFVIVYMVVFFVRFCLILYVSVYFCKLCIFIVMFMYSYNLVLNEINCYVCSVLCILFHCVVLCIVCV